MDIRQFALPSRQDPLDCFATTTFEGSVTIWSFAKQCALFQFQTCYDNGGVRMAISPNAKFLIAASFKRNLVEQYTVDGTLVWSVSIKQPQRLTWLESQGCWCVVTECNEAHLLDQGGKELICLSHIERIIPLDQEHCLAVHAESLSLLNGQMRSTVRLGKRGFGVLDAVRYTDGDVAVVFAGGVLESFSVADGSGVQLAYPKGLPQALSATASRALIAQIDVPGKARKLVRLATVGQRPDELLTLPWESGRGVFAAGGKYFLSHHAGVWEVAMGTQAWKMHEKSDNP